VGSVSVILTYAEVPAGVLRAGTQASFYTFNNALADILVAYGGCTWDEQLLQAAARGQLARAQLAIERGARTVDAARAMAEACGHRAVAEFLERVPRKRAK
jgi:hypothetical protein